MRPVIEQPIFNRGDLASRLWFHAFSIARCHHASLDDARPETYDQVHLDVCIGSSGCGATPSRLHTKAVKRRAVLPVPRGFHEREQRDRTDHPELFLARTTQGIAGIYGRDGHAQALLSAASRRGLKRASASRARLRKR